MQATCHPDKPNKAHGLCANCYARGRADKRREWAKANPDKLAAARERHASKDPEALKKYRREWMRQWRASHLEQARESKRLSDARARERDPEGYRDARREAYRRHIANPDNAEKHRASGRERRARQAADLTLKRRGITKAEVLSYWEHRGHRCDICGGDLPKPGSYLTVVDHDKDHCNLKIGCRGCVRGLLHRDCNLNEGAVRKLVKLGAITSMTGPLADYLADPPFKRWESTNT